MTPSARSWYASVAGAFVLVVLLAIIALYTVPELLR